MLCIFGASHAIVSFALFCGATSFDEPDESPATLSVTDQDREDVQGDESALPASAPLVSLYSADEFSAKKLKDPAGRWIVTIAVANDIATVKPGDMIDFFALLPQDDPTLISSAAILRSLSRADGLLTEVIREDVRIDIERVVDNIAEPRFFPMVGAAQLHRQEFKCNVHSRKTTRSDGPVPNSRIEQSHETICIGADRLIPVVDGKPVVENVQVVGATNTCIGGQNREQLIVAVTPTQAVRLKSAKKSSATVFIRPRRP